VLAARIAQGLLLLLLAGIVAVPWSIAVREIRHPDPVKAATHSRAVVWGDRVFVARKDLARWLLSHGETYQAWAARHPSSPLARGRARSTTTASGHRASPASRRALATRVVAAARIGAGAASGPSRTGLIFELLLLTLGTLAVATAFMPVSFVQSLLHAEHPPSPDTRVFIAGGGLVTLVGVAVSVMFG